MKKLAIASALAASSLGACATPEALDTRQTKAISAAAPGLAAYSAAYVDTALWERPGLSKRDRSVVTLSALIARNQLLPLEAQLVRALENGLTPLEISEIITHLAFYSGWGNATGAAAVAQRVFEQQGLPAVQLPDTPALPLDAEQEAIREQRVAESFGQVSPGVVENTTNLLFRDAWLRPGLAMRDKSLVTVSSLVASGQTAQIPPHLNWAMDRGLTQTQASEVLTQLAFYAGWPNVFSALPVFKEVFAKRPA